MSGFPRWVGLLAAIALLWLGFEGLSEGVFLTPRNLYNLAVQTSVVAILACGMVLVIASGQIDLSVGSALGLAAMVGAVLQAAPPLGLGWPWPLALAAALATGAAIGAWNAAWIAWRGVPSFVVTLAGLLIFRGLAFATTEGRTVAPLADGFQLLGGGLRGSIGEAPSIALALIAIALAVVARARARARSRRHGLEPTSLVRDGAGLAAFAVAALGFALVMNAATRPGGEEGRGIPAPVLIALGCAGVTAFLAHATAFGRHVFAIGASAPAARRAGVAVARVLLGVFVWMGVLAGVAGAVTSARLGAGTNGMGTLAELSAIAAAVIGGTSLAGGVGHIGGALLGALLMQSLENGLVLVGAPSALRQVAIGLVLIAAVQLDGVLRRRTGAA